MERPGAISAAMGSLSTLRAQQREASLSRQTLNHVAVDACAGQLHFHGVDASAVDEGVLRVSAQAGRLTVALCQRIKGNTLQLKGLPHELEVFVRTMPEDGWAALQQRARALHGEGITRIELGRSMVIDDALVNGLLQCTALRWLVLSDAAVVDFHTAALLATLPATVKVMHGARLIRDLNEPHANEAPATARVAKHLGRTAAQEREKRQYQAAGAALGHAVARTDLDSMALVNQIDCATTEFLAMSDRVQRGVLDHQLCAQLNAAMEHGRLLVVIGLTRGILKSSRVLVDHERMLALLTARSPSSESSEDEDLADLPASLQSLQNRLSVMPQTGLASNYSRAIGDYVCALSTLDDEPHAGGDAAESSLPHHANPTMLHRICCELHLQDGEQTPPPNAIYAAIKAYLSDIVNWHALLLLEPERITHWHHPSAVELAQVVAARHSSRGVELTAAQVAMNSGHPGAAGAMLMAILESQAEAPLKRSLIDALGVDPRLVAKALVSIKVQRPWVSAMADAIMAGHVAVLQPTVNPPHQGTSDK